MKTQLSKYEIRSYGAIPLLSLSFVILAVFSQNAPKLMPFAWSQTLSFGALYLFYIVVFAFISWVWFCKTKSYFALLERCESFQQNLCQRSFDLFEAEKEAKMGSFSWDPRNSKFQGSWHFFEMFHLPQNTSFFLLLRHCLRSVEPEERKKLIKKIRELGPEQLYMDFELNPDHKATPQTICLRIHQAHRPTANSNLIQGTVHNITTSRYYEQNLSDAFERVEELESTKREFLNNVSHELRTPMNGIMGMTDFVISSTDCQDTKDYLAVVMKCSNNLLLTLNNMIDLAKMESGEMTLDMQNYSFAEELKATINLFVATTEKKGLGFKVDVDPDIPNFLFGDHLKLRQVLGNVLGNAYKFTNGGEICLKIRKTTREKGTDKILFEVSDTGIGIAQKEFGKIFQSFVQGFPCITKSFDGAGLGLAISKQLLAYMDGEIWFESVEGKGSHFFFTIPFETAREFKEESPKKVGLPDVSHLKILLVDDNNNNLVLGQKVLMKSGATVLTAEDGLQALELVQEEKVDIVLMDLHMPVMDGFVSARKIKEMNLLKGEKALPIIALSANGSAEDRFQCSQVGIVDFIQKPFRKLDLLEKLQKYGPNI